MKTILEKLNTKYSPSRATTLANEGKWAEAAEACASQAMWGLWAECRDQAGLPSDEAAKNEIIAAFAARRAARFAKK